ncbi:MAG: acetyltransferase family [Bacillales bacterium]|nr:acetyltransferase family [Bacillales bacterium]
MAYEIKKLTPELANDYIKFFEKYAFSDGSEFAGCYCTWYNWNVDYEKKRNRCSDEKKKSFKKDLAYQAQAGLQTDKETMESVEDLSDKTKKAKMLPISFCIKARKL